MDDIFIKKVKTASSALWTVILIAILMQLGQWGIFLWLNQTRSEILLAWMGNSISWEQFQLIWIYFVSAFKLCIWLMVLTAIWLHLWARKLQK